MKKKRFSRLLAAGLLGCCALCFTACQESSANSSPQAAESNAASAEQKPADTSYGYPEWNVQREYVFVNRQLYLYADQYETELPADLKLLGTVQQEDGTRCPDTELAAANVPVGTKVYVPTTEPYEAIYVEIDSKRYECFVPEQHVQGQFVFVQNCLYAGSDDRRRDLPEDAELLGAVEASDGTQLPETEFAAANVPVGAKLYKTNSEDMIFVELADESFVCFFPSQG